MYSFKSIVIPLLIAWIAYRMYTSSFLPEEFSFNTTQFIQKYGFDVETHEYETSDGVITSIFRISPKNELIRGPPVLMEGGMFCSSDTSMLTGPDKDLSFILANAGFDVWVGNHRGGRYSRRAENSSVTEHDWYFFGFEEMSEDYAGAIDHVRNITGHDKIHVIAISLASPCMLILMSNRPEYNNKINKLMHFGGTAKLRLDTLSQYFFFNMIWKFPAIGFLMLPPYRGRGNVMKFLCMDTLFTDLCILFLSQTTGMADEGNKTLAALLFTLLPSGAPMGVVDQLMQLSYSDAVLTKRDYGQHENTIRYNSSTPPEYDFSNVTVWSKVYNVENDVISKTEAMMRVFQKLPKMPEVYVVPEPFVHQNFLVYGARDKNFVNDVIRTLKT